MTNVRLPEVDKQFDGTVISSVDRESATCARTIKTKGGTNPNLEEQAENDDEGPCPAMMNSENDDDGIRFGGGATCDNAAGQRIVRTSWAVFRNGVAILDARPAPGDHLCTVWTLDGGGHIHAPARRGNAGPATLMTTWYDDCGAEFDGHFVPTAASRRATAAAAAARRCACGNFKTPGHGECNACRAAIRRPATAAAAAAAPGDSDGPSPKRRRTPAAGELVVDLTGDD